MQAKIKKVALRDQRCISPDFIFRSSSSKALHEHGSGSVLKDRNTDL